MKFLFPFFLVFTLISGQALAIETAAKQAYMIDSTTGAVLMNKNGDEQMHPSSMSKLMTLYILFSRLKEGRVKLDSLFPVSERAWRMQGSKMFVELGNEISVEDLLHGIIIQSGNDACIVVAEGVSGSEEAFAKEMNATAQKLGLSHSHFTNATGMPDDGHLMSARDLAVLSQRLIEDFPEYYPYFAMTEYTYHNIKQHNRNRLLGTLGVDGLKTGHTEAGGYGIALSAKQGERRLILVVNGMESDKQRYEEGDKLLRWGFREFNNKTLVSAGQKVAEADVWFGKQATVPLVAARDLTVTLPAAAQNNVKMVLSYTGPLATPVTKGDKVAELVITPQGMQPMRVPLLAGEDVAPLTGFGRLKAAAFYYLSGQKK